MPGESVTLLQGIGRQPEHPVLVADGEQYTPSSLQFLAEQLRSKYPVLHCARLALRFSSPRELLLHLIAFDGYASAILLLPPDVDDATRATLLSDATIAYLLDEQGLQETRGPARLESHHSATQWLFTTSGTTGMPKVFSHTLASLSAGINTNSGSASAYRWGLVYKPHRFAGIQVVIQALLSGSLLVVTDAANIAVQLAQFIAYGVNCLSATPSQWRTFLIHGAIRQCSLRQITLGGEIADQAILSALQREFPQARILHIYASTEAGVGFRVADGRAGFPLEWIGEGAPCAMRISEQGNLLIKSDGVSQSAALSDRIDGDGYLDTQDGVTVSGDRVLFAGRATGVINVGGHKVYPEEVENIVREVSGVQNAVVSAKKNPIVGQLVTAVVQAPAASAEEKGLLKKRVLLHCKDRLEKHKVPAIIRIVDNLAISDSGKVERGAPK